MFEKLSALIGREHRLDEVSHIIRAAVCDLRPAVVGAHQINCSDESERECVESFHQIVVRDLLPELKFHSRSSFRTVNLGGRYELGSAALAEDHYATSESADAFKVLVIKINAHVSVVEENGELICGRMERYERESVYCGALHALLDGASGLFLDELRTSFQQGIDRVAMLTDPQQVAPKHRALFAAATSASLQSARAAADVLQHRGHTPTVYLICGAVTLNRHDDDTELLIDVQTIDERNDREHLRTGLGDDPRRYRLSRELGRLRLSQTEPETPP